MNDIFLEVRRVTKTFGRFAALEDVSLSVKKGELMCLLGPSGCGKTTLLRIIAGLEEADTGLVLMEGDDITPLPPMKRNFGIVFQSYALFPNLTAGENVAYGLNPGLLNRRKPRVDGRARVREVLDLVGLSGSEKKFPAQLSGGQQQRVALARALALSPKILLLDEPLSALDARVRVRLRRELCDIQRKLGITTLMVTHDQEEALTMADRIAVMNDAVIVQTGTPREIYERPADPFVADFIGSVNFFPSGHGLVPARYGPGLVAIRPEHIHVLENVTDETIPARVRSWEFRGPFYRVILELEGAEFSGEVTVDMPANRVREMDLESRPLLGIHLPEDRVLVYPETDRVRA